MNKIWTTKLQELRCMCLFLPVKKALDCPIWWRTSIVQKSWSAERPYPTIPSFIWERVLKQQQHQNNNENYKMRWRLLAIGWCCWCSITLFHALPVFILNNIYFQLSLWDLQCTSWCCRYCTYHNCCLVKSFKA